MRLAIFVFVIGMLMAMAVRADDVRVTNLDLSYGHVLDGVNYFGYKAVSNYKLDLGLAKGPAYVTSSVHGTTDQTQFREVGLAYNVGAHVTKSIDIYYGHSSAHILDATIDKHFPYMDEVAITWHLL